MKEKDKIIKELNKFLTGINMAYDTFKTYEEKVNDKNLKNEFIKVLNTFASQKKLINSYINDLDPDAKEPMGIDAKVAEIFQKMKDMFMHEDKDIVNHALKNIERGITSSERVALSLQKMTSNEEIINSLNNIVDEFKNISDKFQRIYESM